MYGVIIGKALLSGKLEPESLAEFLDRIAKRIIACLDIKDGRTVKGVEFVSLRDAGDPVELARAYSQNGIDELVFLDITARLSAEKRYLTL